MKALAALLLVAATILVTVGCSSKPSQVSPSPTPPVVTETPSPAPTNLPTPVLSPPPMSISPEPESLPTPMPSATLNPTPLPTPTYTTSGGSGGGGGGSPPVPTTSLVATPTPVATESLDWSVSLTVSAGNEGINQNLAFGTRWNATDDLDVGVDMPHPPLAPGSTFDAYFSSTSPLFPQLDKDYQAPLSATTDIRVWELTMKSASNDIILSWDISGIPPELLILVQTDTAVIDIRTQSSMVIPTGDSIVTISASR